MMNLTLDHVMVGVPDLDSGTEWFQQKTGVRPRPGGAHPGLGTHNALASLGPQTYLEIIATDPNGDVGSDLTRRLASIERPTPLGWCFSCTDADAMLAELEGAGVGATVIPVSREQPGGGELSWRVVLPHHDLGPAIPFFIDWDGTPTPASTSPPGCELQSVMPVHQDPALAQALLDRMGVPAKVTWAQVSSLRIEFRSGDGSVIEVGP
jgi:catechol 2,3-dioxygenase-like lactoylglutathione lyase family enzyme